MSSAGLSLTSYSISIVRCAAATAEPAPDVPDVIICYVTHPACHLQINEVLVLSLVSFLGLLLGHSEGESIPTKGASGSQGGAAKNSSLS